ncbi:hypothetical protein YC2023_018359 [Brassica napus]
MVLDNEALCDICLRTLKLSSPSYPTFKTEPPPLRPGALPEPEVNPPSLGSREGGRFLGLSEPPDLVLPFKIYGGSLHGGARDSVGSSSTVDLTYHVTVRLSEEWCGER